MKMKKKRNRNIIIVFESGMAQTDYGFREMLLWWHFFSIISINVLDIGKFNVKIII